MRGWQETAPQGVIRWFERAQFVHEHVGWTYRDYDEADAADILLDRDYHAIAGAQHGES